MLRGGLGGGDSGSEPAGCTQAEAADFEAASALGSLSVSLRDSESGTGRGCRGLVVEPEHAPFCPGAAARERRMPRLRVDRCT